MSSSGVRRRVSIYGSAFLTAAVSSVINLATEWKDNWWTWAIVVLLTVATGWSVDRFSPDDSPPVVEVEVEGNDNLVAAGGGTILQKNAIHHHYANTPSPPGAIVFRPPPDGGVFEGRVEELAALDVDDTVAVTAVSGIGGVGKTRLAAHAFHARKGSCRVSAWINAEHNRGLADLEQLAERLDVTRADDPLDTAMRVKEWFEASPDEWQLVFDNVIKPSDVLAFLPSSPHGRVIVTSRHRDWSQMTQHVVPVDVLDPAESIAVLEKTSGRVGDPDVEELANDLGHLPLALTLAGSYCHRRSIPFAEYRARFAEHGVSQLDEGDDLFFQRVTAAIWRNSLAAAEAEAPSAGLLLAILARIDWRSIGREWLSSGLAGSRFWTDRRDVESTLGVLADLSIIILTDTHISVTHGLIAEGARTDLTIASSTDAWDHTLALLYRSLEACSADEPSDDVVTALLRHVTACTPPRAFVRMEQGILIRAAALSEAMMAQSHIKMSRLRTQMIATLDEMAEVLRELETKFGPDKTSVDAWTYLATQYRDLGEVECAVEAQERVVAGRRRIFGRKDPGAVAAAAVLRDLQEIES